MYQDIAQQLASAVEAVQAHSKFTSVYNACKAAGVPFADYKNACFLVYGLNATA